MSSASYRPVGSQSQFYLLAAARAVDTNALASTVLEWQNGANAANSLPVVARLFRRSGTLSLLIATLTLNGTTVQAISAVQSALLGAAADPLQYPLSSAVAVAILPVSGNWGFTVGTINGTASSIDVLVYGMLNPQV